MKMTDLFNEDGSPKSLVELEREQLEVLKRKCHGNVAQIAEILNIDRKQAYRRLYRVGLHTPKKGQYADRYSKLETISGD